MRIGFYEEYITLLGIYLYKICFKVAKYTSKLQLCCKLFTAITHMMRRKISFTAFFFLFKSFCFIITMMFWNSQLETGSCVPIIYMPLITYF